MGTVFWTRVRFPSAPPFGATICIFLLSGGIAQLGERLNGIQEVSGSIPLISTRISARRAEIHTVFFILIRACSSVGRALRSQRRGHGFESHQVHHEKGTCASECLFWLSYSAQTEKNTGFISHCAPAQYFTMRESALFHIRRQPDISLKLPRRNISHKATADNRL